MRLVALRLVAFEAKHTTPALSVKGHRGTPALSFKANIEAHQRFKARNNKASILFYS